MDAALACLQSMPWYHRRSIRLKTYDYALPGAYFVTICAHRRWHLFGRVVAGEIVMNALGQIAAEEWVYTEAIRPNVKIDAYVVMPNHVHAVVTIVDAPSDHHDSCSTRRGTPPACPPPFSHATPLPRQFGGARPGTLATILRQYKSAVTRRANAHRGAPGTPVWQRGYWERILRDARQHDIACRYVHENPLRWHRDRLRL